MNNIGTEQQDLKISHGMSKDYLLWPFLLP